MTSPSDSEPSPSPTCLDLGSGPCPAAGYSGVDLTPQELDGAPIVYYADLFGGTPWPFASGSVRRLRAWHVIEHIPHDRVIVGKRPVKRTVRSSMGNLATHYESVPITADAFFWFFDEAYRIAEPGCRFELAWPHPQSDGADQDPSHCRRVPTSMLNYLSETGRRMLRVHHYPVGCNWIVEPGSVQELGSDESLAPFTLPDGSIDIPAARRSHGAFHEIRATLIKP